MTAPLTVEMDQEVYVNFEWPHGSHDLSDVVMKGEVKQVWRADNLKSGPGVLFTSIEYIC